MKKNTLFGWKARPTTSAVDGSSSGCFTVVGEYDVMVFERRSHQPVTGGMVIAESQVELERQVEAMLNRFEPRWLAQSPKERQRNMAIAAKTAQACGWLDGDYGD